MSNFAENFITAATWQLRHQLAQWKARAVALQYENDMLHEVIRRNLFAGPTAGNVNEVVSESEPEQSDIETEDAEEEDCQTEENPSENESENDGNENGDGLEVSEEFIQFLIANAKYKEDARREREHLKAKLDEESKCDVPEQESIEHKISHKKELYGDNYFRIMALEMYLKADYQNALDKTKATYWPNIPFNFNC